MCKFYLCKVQKQAKLTSGIEPMLAVSYLWSGERGSAWERHRVAGHLPVSFGSIISHHLSILILYTLFSVYVVLR